MIVKTNLYDLVSLWDNPDLSENMLDLNCNGIKLRNIVMTKSFKSET